MQLPPGQARGAREGRRSPGWLCPARVHDDRDLRRDRDGSRGDEGIVDVARPDRRFGRADDARGAPGCARRDRGLRQIRARHADGDGPDGPAVRLPVRRDDPARHVSGPRHHDPRCFRSRRWARAGTGDRRRAPRPRASRVPHDRVVCGDVYGEHDGSGGSITGARSRRARAGSPPRTSWSSVSGHGRS